MSSEGATCNIDLKGRRIRQKVYRTVFKGAIALSVVNAALVYFDVTNLRVLAPLWGLICAAFCAFAVTRAEVMSNICVIVGALGKEETSSMAWKPIADARRVAMLRTRSVMIVLRGSLMGLALAFMAICAPYFRLGGPFFLTVKLPWSPW